ncbi:MAG: enoyl-CoA hydratase-related protein [Planctomycetaceae bacterium]
MSEVLLTEDIGPIRRLTMNRPDKLNALNGELLDAIVAAFREAGEDDSVSVIILAAAGRAFCAGYDLEEDAEAGELTEEKWREELQDSTDRLFGMLWNPKPTIAQVQSYCLAGGTDLMLACDLTVCSDDAKFGYVDIRFGSGVVTMLLPWVVGMRTSKELLFTGEDRISAEDAHRIGMVNRVVPADRLEAETMALAEEIAKNEPFVIQRTKQALHAVWERQGIKQALDANVEQDVAIETANLPARDEFRRITSEQGLKAAIAWRDARFRGEIG